MGYEKRQFLYGMDFDTEERLVEQGFTRKNVNVRIGSSTDNGVLSAENVQGNKLIPNVELPDGENKVIGNVWDKVNDLNYFFVWNSEGNHGIYEYNHVPAKITTVMIAEVLNFQSDKLITGINVVEFDSENDFLYWTDNFNPPRKLNIQKAKSGRYLTPIKEEVIDAIKYPPLFPPTASFENDDSFKQNYFKESIWQFKAAYVYDDKEVSAYSPISVQVLPDSNCLSGGSLGNTIKIVIPKGGELVERVIIAGREGNLNDFKELIDQSVDDYETDADGNYIYKFKNDGVYANVNLVESNKLFDNLPQLAKAQEYIDGNRIVYANITEGYDNVDVDYSLDMDFEEEEEVSTTSFRGYLRISNGSLSGQYGSFQPIYESEGSIVFGGFGESRSGITGDAFQSTGSINKQFLPLGGFVVYLAGTNYYAITEQALGNNSDLQNGNKQNAFGGMNQRSNRNSVRDEIEGSGSNPWGDTRVFSTFNFDNIPDGTYILRVASNDTTMDDLLDPSLSYQKTSTYVNRIGFGVTRGNNQSFVKELIIELENGQIVNNPSGGDIEIVISDQSNPKELNNPITTSIAGYLTDSEQTGSVTFSSIEEILGYNRVAYAEVGTNYPGRVFTDHNGFFFQRAATSVTSFSIGDSSTIAKGYDVGDSPGSLTPLNLINISFGSTKVFAVPLLDSNITENERTRVLAVVEDSLGNRLKGATVVSHRDEFKVTDSNGEAEFIIYAEGGTSFLQRGFLYVNADLGCSVNYNPNSQFFTGTIGEGDDRLNNDDTTVLPTVTATLENISSRSALKLGGVYKYGLVYYDKANRSGATNYEDSGELFVPFYTEGYTDADQDLDNLSRPPIVNWEIKNRPPLWATHYQWVRTKNTAVNDYIQWYTEGSGVEYYDASGDLSNPSDATVVKLDLTTITDEYNERNPDSVLSYDYTTRDRFRIIKDSNSNYFDEYVDVKVLGFENGILTIENTVELPDLTDGVFFEVYTPKLEEENSFFYEIGECYEVGRVVDADGNTLTYHKGDVQDQDPNDPSGVPATGSFKTGDTYYRYRDIPTTNGFYKTRIDSQLFSDFWQSKVSDIGRPNVIDKDAKRVNRPTTIYYSDRFVPETNINGLNSFYDTAFEQYDRKYGSVQLLDSRGKRLDCYQELRIGQIMVSEDVTFTPDGDPIISYSDNVLSKINYYKGEYGTFNPESFAENEGRRYIFDLRNGKVIRISNDGITPISDYKMHSYFESKSNFYSAFGIIPEIWGVYDENFNEYVISFGSVSRDEGFTPDDLALVGSQAETVTEERNGLTYTFIIGYDDNAQGVETDFEIVRDLQNGTYVINSTAGDLTLDRQRILSIPAETLGFSEKTKHWTSFYTYTPECMGRVGIDFLTFRNGNAFLHNQSGSRNTFYGSTNSSEVWVVFNENPSVNKVYQALSEESDTVWEAREIVTQNGQLSNLIRDDFAVDMGQGNTIYSKENIHYAALWKDTRTDVDIPLLNGDSMRDVSILFKLINDSTEEERLFATSVRYSLSPRVNG